MTSDHDDDKDDDTDDDDGADDDGPHPRDPKRCLQGGKETTPKRSETLHLGTLTLRVYHNTPSCKGVGRQEGDFY